MNAVGRRRPWVREGAPVFLAAVVAVVFLLMPIMPIITACNEESQFNPRMRSKRRFMTGSFVTGGSRGKVYSRQDYEDCLQKQPKRWLFYAAYATTWLLASGLTYMAYSTMKTPTSRVTRIIIGTFLPIAIVGATGLAIGLTVESFD